MKKDVLQSVKRHSWIVAAIVLLAVGLWLIVSQHSFQDCVNEQVENSVQKDAYLHLAALGWCLPEFIDSNAELLIAVFTVVLGFGTVWLAFETRRLASDAQQTSRRSLRAYVFIDKVKIERLALGENPRVIMKIVNFGDTPAYDVMHASELMYHPYPIAEPFPPRVLPPNPTMVSMGPTASMEKMTDLQDANGARANLTEDHMAALRDRTGCLILGGEIHYRDTFGQNWHTTYRMIYGGLAPAEGQSMMAYPGDNEAT